ncbi:E3 ubiquitin-protein ligase RNF186 [Paroedura picta]|uniref:E3 ubiquitin-protein ligase RNF186 n=1 Tax=Paroedura picta TaxID=143630 RepID=UPI004057B64F
MEGPADSLSTEEEAGREGERPGRAPEGGTPLKSPEGPTPRTDRGPADDACAVDLAAPGCPSAAAERLAADGDRPRGTEGSGDLGPPASITMGLPQPSPAPSPELRSQRKPKASVADMDCLICFNRYSPSRLPKLLSCQHAFCAVCLKLILRNEDHTWLITCPLCRTSTVVFGGLVCSLHDKEDVLDRLDSPDPEAPCPPPPVGSSQATRWCASRDREPPSHRPAGKRLVLLLLLLVTLIALVLPFMYTGLLKWALGSVVGVGLILSGILCCSPSWNCSGPSSWPPWRRKESHVLSVA